MNDFVSRRQLVDDRQWKDKLIDMYLHMVKTSSISRHFGKDRQANGYQLSEVLKIERYLTKIGIEFKAKYET